jgi:pimeloyl-ACP methyl ester carboxylesterase
MAARVYALLVGINDYPSDVGKLAGCLNDVDHLHAYLNDNLDKATLAVEVLKDGEATRDNVIKQFRGHLGRAREGDVALFQYCGHGARWTSAKAFKEFYPDGKDEGLVCIDSRAPGGFDLADKELAILISEVAKSNSHVAVMLDCCHSGSGTRGVDSFRGLRPRLTYEVSDERPLESYLDGYYADLRRKDQPLFLPTGRHILLAACERTQLAQEAPDRSGVFTSTLLEVLDKSAGDLTYSDLFVRCRAAVRTRADNQNPQFEAYGNFNASSGFLGRSASHRERRYSVYFDQGSWKIDCGAIHGVPTEPEKTVALALYPENDQAHQSGTATMLQIGPQRSELKLGFASDDSARYRAEITSLPLPPMPIHFKEEPKGLGLLLQEAIKTDGAANVTLTDIEEGARYALSQEGGNLVLKQRETNLLIQGVEINDGNPGDAADKMLPILKHVARWERSLALQNLRTQMDPSLVDFVFAERLDDGTEHVYPTGEIILDYAKRGGQWKEIRGKLKARNRTRQTLHAVLAYFSPAYGIHILKNDPIDPRDGYVTLWGDLPEDYFYLEDAANESIESFKLIVSTEKVDDFLLSQDGLVMGKITSGSRAIGSVNPMSKLAYRNEWFTRNCRIKVVRRLEQVGARDASLARGRIVVRGHPSIKANLSLSAAKSHARGAAQGTDFYKAFERQGMEMLNFAGTRGDDESILELTDIQNAAALNDDPLRIEVNVPLKENEAILPLVFDGQHVLLGGDPYKDDDGNTHISIDHVPDVADHRRSLGSALKLYFFKTYLRQDDVNRLRSVQYAADGSFAYQEGTVADKVTAAQNILLLVHGIIGDTEGMAAGARTCGLDRKFDLVLTYDYENLSTPIAETAQKLKFQLAAAGLDANDDKRLTILAHSMGGLVSRWFIEREDGDKVVDHLVMCGTPNNGSPFGRVEDARRILNVLTGLAMNYIPALVPFSSAVIMLLNRSKKLTPTLEQMNAASEFMKALNASKDPGIPYTILAGDIEAYKEPSDQLFAKMLVKAGQSFIFEALFANKANDIAVGVESILSVGSRRASTPTRRNVACHHLNYFASDAGQQALMEADWSKSTRPPVS